MYCYYSVFMTLRKALLACSLFLGECCLLYPDSMVHTNYCITCLAAPSFRTRGKEGHGLKAVLRGVEGNTELMDSVRQVMVALDQSLIELGQSQRQIIR